MPRVRLTPDAFNALFPDPRYDAKNRKFAAFEQWVFDSAIEFATVCFQGRGTYTRESFGDDFFAAKAAVLGHPRKCLYAANAPGRSIVLDRKDLPYWTLRYNRVVRPDPLSSTGKTPHECQQTGD